MKDIKAGAAQKDITPSIGTPLAGNLRGRKSEAIDIPLYTRALILSDGDKYTVIVSLDLIAIYREHVEKACKLIYEQTGIPRESILVCASHTHSGPFSVEVLDPDIKPNQPYMNDVCAQIAQAVNDAHRGLESVKIGFASTTIGSNQRYSRLVDKNGRAWWNSPPVPPEKSDELKLAGPLDEELLVLAIKNLDNDILSIVFNYPLHAEINLPNNTISADYPGVVAELISGKLGKDVITLYAPAACADIVPMSYKKEKMKEVGEAITSAILSSINRIEYVSKCRLDCLLKEVALPLRDFSHFQEEEVTRLYRGYDGSQDPTAAIEVFRKEYEYLSKIKEKEIRSVLHTLVVNDAAFISAPGELFCELGLYLKTHSPFRYNFVAELADDYIGYLPTVKVFEQGGYETINARSAKVAAGSGEKIVGESLDMLKKLIQDN